MVSSIDLLDDFKKGSYFSSARHIGKQSADKGRLLSELVKAEGIDGLLANIYAADTLAEA